MKKTSFGNYGIAPSATLWNVSQFISTYMTIAITNIVLMILLCVIVIYIILRNMVLPVLRITRELKQCIEAKSKPAITVRKSDKLLIPLVEMINKLS
jgi:uncharacterized protein (DUF58 family)